MLVSAAGEIGEEFAAFSPGTYGRSQGSFVLLTHARAEQDVTDG